MQTVTKQAVVTDARKYLKLPSCVSEHLTKTVPSNNQAQVLTDCC